METVYCPIFKRDISNGYCWELCNIATDDILLNDDVVSDWDEAQKICDKCGLFSDEKIESNRK